MTSQIVGEGDYSTISKIETPDGIFAFKKIKADGLSAIEADILFRLKCPYLIRGHKVVFNNDENGIIMDLMHGDLSKDHLFLKNPDVLIKILGTLSYGLACLHSKSFIHSDIHPNNCLYLIRDKETQKMTKITTPEEIRNTINPSFWETNEIVSYVADYGSVVMTDDPRAGIDVDRERIKFSKGYSSPEMLTQYTSGPIITFNEKTDIWALGLTFLYLLGFRYRFDIKKATPTDFAKYWERHYTNGIEKLISSYIDVYEANLLYPMKETVKLQLFELISRMMKFNPSERISSNNLKSHELFKDMKLDESCIFDQTEYFYIPAISQNTINGIQALRKFFMNDIYYLKTYFLAVDIFMRLVSMVSRDISRGELQKFVAASGRIALNYYRDANMRMEDFDMKVVKALGGKLGENRYYYLSEKVAELKLVDEIVLKNPTLLSFYNKLNPDELYSYFRNNYDLNSYSRTTEGGSEGGSEKSDQYTTTDKFFLNPTPERISNEPLKGITISDFTQSDKIVDAELDKEYESYSEAERELRKVLVDAIEKELKDNSVNKILSKVEEIMKSGDSEFIYHTNYVLNDNYICEIMREYLGIDYSIINIDNPKEKIKEFNILREGVNFYFGRYDKDSKTLYVYFTGKNEKIMKLTEKYNLNYGYFDDVINSCKILELGYLVMMYTSVYLSKFNIEMLRLNDNTMKLMLMLFEIHNENKYQTY